MCILNHSFCYNELRNVSLNRVIFFFKNHNLHSCHSQFSCLKKHLQRSPPAPATDYLFMSIRNIKPEWNKQKYLSRKQLLKT